MTPLTTYEYDGTVATITFDDGKVNAFSIPMLRALHEALDRAEEDGAAVVLTGREGVFSAGFDLRVFAAGGRDIVEMLELGGTLAERILAFPRPVVAACTGHALPTGVFLLLASDFRLGADGPFRIGLNEVSIGITLPWFAIELARYRLHPAYLDAAVVQSAIFSPPDAVAPGFLDVVVAPDELRARSREAAERLAALDARAFAETKQRLRAPAVAAMRRAVEQTVAELDAALAGA